MLSFEKNKIGDYDNLCRVYDVKAVGDREHELMVKIKDVPNAEKSARSIQTGFSTDKDVLIALKSIT